MVVCVIALVVFGILSIFSATHRAIAREAFDCVFRKMTLRPCNTGLDKRLKMLVSMKVMKHNEGAGKFVHTNFEAISFVFMLLMIGSIVFSGIGIYNFWAYGNCNGQNSSELCLLNPETYSNTNPLAWLFPPSPSDVLPVSSEGLPMRGTTGAPVQIIEVGCFSCPFTKSTEPLVDEVMAKYDGKVALYFKYFPLPKHEYSLESSEAAECARDQNKFWEYKELLFTRQLECAAQPNAGELHSLHAEFAEELGLDTEKFSVCMNTGKYAPYIEAQKQESITAGIYGTPTFFINGKVLVAPKTIEEFSAVIDAELAAQ
ncbi:MAG TPA: thioredoxin domain-containing protein [archaeon]|nr:thioredoxin domain-containing protein [archaeon]